MRFCGLIPLLVTIWITPAVVAQEDPQEVEQRLTTIRAEIKALQSRIDANEGQRSAMLARLADAEREIGAIGKRVRVIEQRIAQQNTELADLTVEQTTLQSSLESRRDTLAEQLRTAFLMGRQAQLKVILNQENVTSIGRILGYHRYISRSRSAAIEALIQDVRRLAEIRTELEQGRAQLEQLHARSSAEIESRQAQITERKQLLAVLESRIANDDEQVDLLTADEAQLTELLQSLRRAFADIPALNQAPFSQQKGTLPWPARGRVIAAFGSSRSSGQANTGILMQANKGSTVLAVSHGRVAYADWLRGYGLLMIIDHGDGYLSLYGHNDALFREVGDWVSGGEVIAEVGASGGRTEPALYFEIRKDSQAQDPIVWLAKR